MGYGLLVAVFTGCSTTVPPASRPEAVAYFEHQEDGATRGIPSDFSGQSTLDINSVVEIRVDESRLAGLARDTSGAAVVLPVANVLERIDSLNSALEGVGAAAAAQEDAISLWNAFEAGRDLDRGALLDAIERVTDLERRIWEPLIGAVNARQEGPVPRGGSPEANAVLLSLLPAATGGPPGLSWPEVTRALNHEISLLEVTLDTLTIPAALELQISAQRLGRDDAVHLALPGYNDVEAGPIDRFQKVVLEVSQEQLELHEANKELAASIGEQEGLGQTLRRTLEVRFDRERRGLEQLVQTSKRALELAEADFARLAQVARDASTVFPLQSLGASLGGSDAAQAIRADLLGLELALGGIAREVGLLQAYAQLPEHLSQLGAPEAMSLVLGAARSVGAAFAGAANQALFSPRGWQVRFELFDRVGTNLARLPEGTDAEAMQDLRALVPEGIVSDELVAAVDTLVTASRTAVGWLTDVLGGAPRLAMADLNPAPGQTALPLAEDADTEFDIRRIVQGRNPNDEIVVRYQLLAQDRPLPGSWEDRFRIGVYGWSARAMASLGFVRRNGEGTYTPNAMLTWTARYSPWPRDGHVGTPSGFGTWLVSFPSFGLSTTNLDFDDDKEIELGLAATLGLFDDWVLVGYGANLQTEENRWFGFFSIRLFESPGGLGK